MPRLAVVLFVLIDVVAPIRAADPSPAGVDRTFDVPYETVGGETLKLDLVAPKGDGPYPCVVLLHGGAWKVGSRKDLSTSRVSVGFGDKSLADVLAAKGFVAASVSYRLAPRDKFPAQIQDAKTAVRFLRANAARFHLDPTRVGVMGISAGGHLAALLGTTGPAAGFDGDLYPDQSSRVSCVVDFFGPADLSLYAETPAIERIFLVPLLGVSSKAHPDVYRRASPIDYVSKDDPPFLIVHGTADVVVPVVHSERLHERLLAAGVSSELVTVKGAGHGWDGPRAAETADLAVRFLTDHLKKAK